MRSWKVPVNQQWKRQYDQNLLLVTVYLVVTLSLGMITAFFYVMPTEQDKQVFFENDVAEAYFPQWQNFVIWLSKIGFVPLTYISIVQPSLRIVYGWMHAKFHIYNCLFFLKNMTGDDREIARSLKFCLRYHVEITLIVRKILRGVQIYVLPFQIVGTVLIANVAIYYFWFQDVLTDQYLRIFSLGITAFTILFGLAQSGQAIEDVSDDILDVLINLDWCDWSESNKKMYLMFLVNTQRQFKIKYSESISLNYKMGVEMVKTFFSIISVMYRLQK
ncbi:uncharacterized protein LOC135131815 [Zophobas morio]|uniref:uncharacterized protein LOC135131815 n=1 Tax=Zophobas morio TaxID=2755281 RepID=UPI00308316EE